MRKITIFIMLIFASVLLVSCTDNKLSDDSFNVLFYTGQGATKVESYYNVEEGLKIEEPEVPTRDGFRFSGWYKDIKKTIKWDFDNDIIEGSTVLYAKWDSLVWQIEFILNLELGEKFSSSSVVIAEFTADKNINLPSVNRPGGSFKGWSLVPQNEYTLDMKLYSYTLDLPMLEHDDFTLYPIFNNNKYMITFQPRLAGVPTPKPVTGVEYGSEINWIIPLEDTTTHKFIGWFSKNGTVSGDWGIEYLNGNLYKQASNVLLYARWEEK